MLKVDNLKTYFYTREGLVKAVDDVSFQIDQGEAVGLVGESGSGKSVLSLSLLRLVSKPGRIVGGEVLLEGDDLLKIPEKEMRQVRGKKIAMIFQEPMTCLNPVFTIGDQIAEAILEHEGRKAPGSFWGRGPKSARLLSSRVVELLKLVGIPAPENRIDGYPHQMSGGMRQRVMIAMALACKPDLLIADEPTTALDVTIQAQILDLLRRLQQELGMALLLISHDLGVVAEIAHKVLVMRNGKIVEEGETEKIFSEPKHAYTKMLLDSILPLKKRTVSPPL